MKIMVKVAVLFATLLLLTGVAFAADCYEYCYAITNTEVDNPTNTYTDCAVFQFCDDNSGSAGSVDMSLFFDSMKDQGLFYDSSCVGYLKFHGDDLYIFTGIGFCSGTRWMYKGHQMACPCVE